jgi:TRAP-type transport system periplasmic protein
MSKRIWIPIALGIACAFIATDLRAQGPQPVVMRLGTLAPRTPQFERAVATWNRQLAERTNNTLSVRVYWGGSMGDERTMVRRMRDGSLDSANVTSIGLSLIARQVMVMQVPGVFHTYEQVDRVRESVGPELERAFEAEGFHLMGWGDVGRVRIFSRQRILRPEDLRQVHPWVPADDMIFSEMLGIVGANGVRLSVAEVFGGLRTGMIDTVPGTALAVAALQWFTSLQYVTAQSDGFLVGGMIVRKPFLDGLTDPQRAALMDTSRESHGRFVSMVRAADDRAYEVLIRRGVHEVDMSGHAQEWVRLAAQTRQRLSGRAYPAELLSRVERIAAEN